MKDIYMDHAATTPLHKEVKNAMMPIFANIYGNPSSIHSFGRKARFYIDEARRTVAASINASENEIIFTSSGTEADNLALIGTAIANRSKGKHIITSIQEHHAVLHAAQYLENEGFAVTYLPVREDGKVSVDDLKNALTDETILVSIMTVNNETGIIQPIQEIGELLRNHHAYFHTDAVQAFGLIPLDVKALGIDLLTASAHKINGPKGVGFLYVAEHVQLSPMFYGGKQERNRRAGTENTANIVGFQKAVDIVRQDRDDRANHYKELKNHFLKQLQENDVSYVVNGDPDSAISTIVSVSFPNMNVETFLTNLDIEKIAASSGSACTAGTFEPSHVLSAMYGDDSERTTNSIRFSFGINNTLDNVEEAANRIRNIIKRTEGM